jgi:hypothetical protein
MEKGYRESSDKSTAQNLEKTPEWKEKEANARKDAASALKGNEQTGKYSKEIADNLQSKK